MKKIFLISIILVATSLTANANQKHKNLPSSEKIEKNTDLRLVGVIKDEKEITSTKLKKKLKLNTDSKLTDLISGKKKIKLPNPMNGLKKIGKALKPNNPLK